MINFQARFKRYLLLLTLLPLTSSAFSPVWQDSSLTLVSGNNFVVDPRRQNSLTFEHVSAWSFGDLFLFMDLTDYPDASGGKGFYGELSPRISLSKVAGVSFNDTDVLIKDLLITTTFEFGKGDVESFMIGPAVDLDLAYFDYFKLNFYKRFTQGNRDGEVVQITPVWSMSTEFAGSTLIFDGYIDWNIHSDGNYKKNFHFNPQVKYDLSNKLGLAEKSLLLGIEYSYWQNKYGIEDSPVFDTDQSVVSIILKSHF